LLYEVWQLRDDIKLRSNSHFKAGTLVHHSPHSLQQKKSKHAGCHWDKRHSHGLGTAEALFTKKPARGVDKAYKCQA